MRQFRSFLLIIAFFSAFTVSPARGADAGAWLTSSQLPGALEENALRFAGAEGVSERFFRGLYTLVAQPYFEWGVVALGSLVSGMWLFLCGSVGRMGYEELAKPVPEPTRNRLSFSGMNIFGFFRSRAPRSYPVPKTGAPSAGAPAPRHSTSDQRSRSHRGWSLRPAAFTKEP